MPRLLAATGVPERYLGCSLSRFDVSGPDEGQLLQARELSQRYVDEFVSDSGERQDRGLLYVGPPGVGKTHLAVAVLLALVKDYGVRAKFRDFTSLIHEIQSTFDASSRASKHDVLDPVMQADLLVLDELGAQKPTPWVTDTLYLILNRRYNERLPTIFTTNYRLPGGGVGTADRSEERGSPAADGGGAGAWSAPSTESSSARSLAAPRYDDRRYSDSAVSERFLRERARREQAPRDRNVERPKFGDGAPGEVASNDAALARGGPPLLTHRVSPALASRLYEMARPIVIEADDFRQKRMHHAHRR